MILRNDTSIVKSLIVSSVIIKNSITSVMTDVMMTDTTSFKNYENAQCSENVQKLLLITETDSHIEWKLILSVIKMQYKHDFEFLSDNKLIMKESQSSQF